MARVIKIKEWAKRKDPKKGHKLQVLANKMFMAGDIGSKYLKVRRAAEHHLGFWDWQTRRVEVERAGVCETIRCPHQPAGSQRCTSQDTICP